MENGASIPSVSPNRRVSCSVLLVLKMIGTSCLRAHSIPGSASSHLYVSASSIVPSTSLKSRWRISDSATGSKGRPRCVQGAGFVGSCNASAKERDRRLPYSTPNWSKALIPQNAATENVTCSNSASNAPTPSRAQVIHQEQRARPVAGMHVMAGSHSGGWLHFLGCSARSQQIQLGQALRQQRPFAFHPLGPAAR